MCQEKATLAAEKAALDALAAAKQSLDALRVEELRQKVTSQ
jgi:flavin-binding protein dodecin